MKNIPTVSLQIAIALIGVVALIILIWFPLTEGRATNLGLISIYSDPFILYGYITSIPFFITLYRAFKLLGNIRRNMLLSSPSVKALKSIKYCAIILGILITAAGLYVKITHNKDDDPAGFLGICTLTIFASMVIATTAALFERKLQNIIDIKSEKGK